MYKKSIICCLLINKSQSLLYIVMKINKNYVYLHRCKKNECERTKSPLFLYLKMFNTTVKDLLQEALAERTDLFLIYFTISNDQSINIIIDGDNGVRVEDCIFISRAIENNIDREDHDFSLDVASAGAAAPLTLPRQFKKNVGRTLEVKTKTENIEAELISASEDSIDLKWKAREPKPVGKGKVTVQKEKTIAYNDIVEAKVMIKF